MCAAVFSHKPLYQSMHSPFQQFRLWTDTQSLELIATLVYGSFWMDLSSSLNLCKG
jgi:hypothetical protein